MKRLPRVTPITIVSTVSVAALALASCSAPREQDGDEPTKQTSTQTTVQKTHSGTTSAEANTQNAAPRVAATSDEVNESAPYTTGQTRLDQDPGTELVVTDVRVGSHEGFDRVVVEYSGHGTPGIIAGYVDKPRQLASGLPIEVTGTTYLEVMIQGTPMGVLSPRAELIKAGPMDLATGAIKGITHGGVFEADTQYIIGLDQQRPYRAYTLHNPPRVVVDLQK
ncbi:AMIN-like domain-containing (lipo)protein [Corynebacterium mayonis]|uniref:AMIN-like domain-containing (lipo)protein n=1 Tax=Corynebacterium mayonis TaxID=3062461 RepID=UPI00314069FD